MRVAIIGAGISGLSCAYELEKNGIDPVIFEKNGRIGNPTGYSGIFIRAFTRGFKNPFRNFENKYDLS